VLSGPSALCAWVYFGLSMGVLHH